ncbi:polysaccharide deacetylase family protein [Oscillospiraceae bacterium OttesenSCG-928-F05]|nr:polysaccharide deacetylase family protein [Oscillospiraceae bacterium OttesenSCG-928-F05]
MKRKIAAALLCAFLIVGLAGPKSSAATVYFTAVNDRLLDLDSRTMPINSKGIIYVPYTVFNNLDLGVSYYYRADYMTLTFSGAKGTLIFDLVENTATGGQNQYDIRVLSRNGTMYIPARFVTGYFKLSYNYIQSDYGPVVRICSGSAQQTNTAFLVASAEAIKSQYDAYTGGPTPPKPSTGQDPGVTPPTQTPKPPKTVYMTFDVSGPGAEEAVLDALDVYGVPAAFFVAPEDLLPKDDFLRRAAGSGYAFGILLPVPGEESPERYVERAEEANATVCRILEGKTRLVRIAGEAESGYIEALEARGYIVWGHTADPNLNGAMTAKETQSAMNKALQGEGTLVLRLRCTEGLAEVISDYVRQFTSGNYRIGTVTRTTKPPGGTGAG